MKILLIYTIYTYIVGFELNTYIVGFLEIKILTISESIVGN